MKHASTITRVAVLAFLLVHPAVAFCQTLHVIAVGDTDSNVGQSVRADLNNLKYTLQSGFDTNSLHWIELTGRSANPNAIVHALKTVQINPQRDAVMLYYSGHGGFDRTRGHFFSLTHGGNLFRDQVRTAITTPVKPRSWAIITDCCANIVDVSFNSPAEAAPQRRKLLLDNLFFRTTGSVDITSSRPGQVSYCTPSLGGAFTIALCGVFEDNVYSPLRWDDVFRRTRSQTNRLATIMMDSARPTAAAAPGQQNSQIAWSFSPMYGQDVNSD